MQVIYVDHDGSALQQFMITVAQHPRVEALHLFQTGAAALEWVREHRTDTAFLEIQMPEVDGLELAGQLRELDENIRIIFVTAQPQYALEAFRLDAVGYVLKPYSREDICRQLDKAARIRSAITRRICIQTIPSFSVSLDGEVLRFQRPKVEELFALLVDRGERGITSGEAIASLWPNRPGDGNTHALLRVTYKRLADTLTAMGIGDVIATAGNRRFVREHLVECDLYRILAGDPQAAKRYAGEYLREYSWAEDRNGQLYRMLLS